MNVYSVKLLNCNRFFSFESGRVNKKNKIEGQEVFLSG